MLRILMIFMLVNLGALEARVVGDEYRGNTIIYSKDSYNKTNPSYWKKNKKAPKAQRKVKSKKQKEVVSDEYRGDSIKYLR